MCGEFVGLHHVAFCSGTSLDELVEAKVHLEAAGITPAPVAHEVTKSLYFDDPDGNTLEPHVDASDVWRIVQPKEGRLALFPSYLFHGSIRFFSIGVRATM